MAIVIYGIKNCDTMKKARAWLDKRGVDYVFHDYKVDGVERDKLERWDEKQVGKFCSTAPERHSGSCRTKKRKD